MTAPTDQVDGDLAAPDPTPATPGSSAPLASGRPLHRLRDLDRTGRLLAAGIVLLLVLVPLVAAMVNHGRWEPQGDDALIELRARDVGTGRTPLVGQPSTSGTYGKRAQNVAHPGPLGFVVLAPSTRLLGPVTGTLLAAAAVSAASMVAVAWLLFRHLGPRGGAAGVTLVALAALSAGAGGLIDPLSSNFGRMPLLAAAVGVWALWCGDLRVAPLTVAFWSFAAQQHLSVLPAAAVCETYWYGIAALRTPLITATIAAVIDLALSFALIPRFDALGAAWANLGGQGAGALLLLLATRRRRRTVYLAWSHTVITFLAMSVVALAAWWATTALSGVWGLLAGIAVGLVGCLAYGRVMGFFRPQEAMWLAETLPHRLHRFLPLLTGKAQIDLS